MRRALLAAAVVVAAACGTLTGVSSTLSNDGGVPDDGGTPDGSDATPGARFCDAYDASFLCLDFDDPDAAAFSADWDRIVNRGDGVDASAELRPGADLAKSEPRSLFASVAAPNAYGSAPPTARLHHAAGPTTAKHVRVTFELFLAGLDTTATSASVAEIFWQNCGVSYDGAWVFLEDEHLALYANNAAADAGTLGIDTTMWHHVVVDADWSSNSVTLTVDGTPSTAAMTPPCPGATPYEIRLGASLQPTSGSVTVRYDNVVVAVDP